mmetsp:Transcript_7336/g.15074  ORF Transcript_7336/g.15074 Transcript_7336/m.15074 type:complete len:220 (+) Transcript_7336:1765-2424(+)
MKKVFVAWKKQQQCSGKGRKKRNKSCCAVLGTRSRLHGFATVATVRNRTKRNEMQSWFAVRIESNRIESDQIRSDPSSSLVPTHWKETREGVPTTSPYPGRCHNERFHTRGSHRRKCCRSFVCRARKWRYCRAVGVGVVAVLLLLVVVLHVVCPAPVSFLRSFQRKAHGRFRLVRGVPPTPLYRFPSMVRLVVRSIPDSKPKPKTEKNTAPRPQTRPQT